jgi:hypothetical protein
MKRLLASLLSLTALACVALPACADTPAAKPLTISATTATQVKTGPGIFFGATSAGIQTNALSCYDNTSQAGQLLWTGILGAAGAGITPFPSGGVAFATGLNCQVPTAIVTSVTIWYL